MVNTPSHASFQQRVSQWMVACFGPRVAANGTERTHRFLEEALELVQTGGCTAQEAHQLVDYVFSRPAGQKSQEVGGVSVTLAAWCSAHDIDLEQAGEAELRRVWICMEQIRAKQASKRADSPLPGQTQTPGKR